MSSSGGPPPDDDADWSEGWDYYLDEPPEAFRDFPSWPQPPLISPRQRRAHPEKGNEAGTPLPAGAGSAPPGDQAEPAPPAGTAPPGEQPSSDAPPHHTDQQSPAGQPAGQPSDAQQPAPDTELRPADLEESDMLATTLTRPPVSTAA